ncbi:hypothetical protein [Streptomyces vinaceus]|uniref:hypothetical protein n=1 Tax=Streptomyces vinaceus TaxID=1960 RepID=UPI0037FBF5FE
MTHRGGVGVEQLAAEVGWSRKRLWSRFRSRIGLSRKCAARPAVDPVAWPAPAYLARA